MIEYFEADTQCDRRIEELQFHMVEEKLQINILSKDNESAKNLRGSINALRMIMDADVRSTPTVNVAFDENKSSITLTGNMNHALALLIKGEFISKDLEKAIKGSRKLKPLLEPLLEGKENVRFSSENVKFKKPPADETEKLLKKDTSKLTITQRLLRMIK